MTEKTAQKKSSPQKILDEDIIISFLDRITEGRGSNTLCQIQENPHDIENIAYNMLNSSSVDAILKLTRTKTRAVDWVTKPDFDYVGLPSEAETDGFHIAFEKYIHPRVGKRADGFTVIFDALDRHNKPFIVETGCLRVPKNWEGDGQSTFQFDWYAREKRGIVATIDINSESIDSARRACSSVTSTILNDSVAALNALSAQAKQPASLIYLDSFDLDLEDPMPSATHHAMEIMAARNLMGPGTIVCVDDFNVYPLGPGGKGLIVDQFMKSINAEVLYTGYQKVWLIAS